MTKSQTRKISTIDYRLSTKKLRVAIVHDWFVGWGAEAVVYELHKMFPNAPIYTSYCNDEWRKRLNGKVITGYLQRWPFPMLRKFAPFLRGWWFSKLDLSNYDLVISSSGAEAKFVKVGNRKMANAKSPLHVAYIHAPTHYYWNRYDEYLKHPGFGALDPLARFGLKILVGPMRSWDYRAAQQPDVLIANSNYTRRQIKKYYHRDSTVVHPPVDVEYFSKTTAASHHPSARHGFVIAGRHTPYKRFDLAVAACTKFNLPLTVIGAGPETKRLKSMAGPTITFMGKISRGQVREEFQKAEAFIFPGTDDFGIVAVEALAAGTPVIAYSAGGALDYINQSQNGLLFKNQTLNSLANALMDFQKSKFNNSKISLSSNDYSHANFVQNIEGLIYRKP